MAAFLNNIQLCLHFIWLLSAEDLKVAKPYKPSWCESNVIDEDKRAQRAWTWQHKTSSYGSAESLSSL